jgi:hypothetical protein
MASRTKLGALCKLCRIILDAHKIEGTNVLKKSWHSIGLVLLGVLLIAGCSGTNQRDPAARTVELYLQGLAGRDLNQMISNACSDWETQARQEYDSFAAVTLELKDLSCKSTGDQPAYSLVDCTGSIVANYGDEDLQIDVADQTFRVIQEGGEWRVCGYATTP